MPLAEELKLVHRNSISKIKEIKAFISEVNDFIHQLEKRVQPSELTAKEKRELDTVINFINTKLPQSPTGEVSPPIKSERVFQALFYPITANRYRKCLAEMSRIYLITSQEAFIKDYLVTLLTSRKSIMKSDRKITYEEVCNFRSIKSLLKYMAEEKADELSYKNIDEISKYFEEKHNISYYQDFENWHIIREAYYRRNIIVHNRGKTNRIYCQKTGYKKEGDHLHTKLDYVIEVAEVIIEFINFTHLNLGSKFK